MEVSHNVTGKKRKEIVDIVSGIVRMAPIYMRMPTWNYVIGNLIVTRNGTLIYDERTDSETIRKVMESLEGAGFEAEIPIAVETEPSGTVNESKTGNNSPNESETMTQADLETEATDTIEVEPSDKVGEGEINNSLAEESESTPQEDPETEIIDAIEIECSEEVEEDEMENNFTYESETTAQIEPKAELPTTVEAELSEVAEEGEAKNNTTEVENTSQCENVRLAVTIPRGSFTDSTLQNLQKLVNSKENLIKKALAVDNLSIGIDDEKVSFPWLSDGQDSETVKAYKHFITALCDMAKKQKRIT